MLMLDFFSPWVRTLRARLTFFTNYFSIATLFRTERSAGQSLDNGSPRLPLKGK